MTDHLHHLAAAYAFNALDEQERRSFEAHYPSCDICAREVLEFQETTTHLADAEATTPPASLNRSVTAAVQTTRQVSPLLPDSVVDLDQRRRRNTPRPILLAAAAAAVVFVVGIVGTTIRSRPNQTDLLIAAPDAITTELTGSAGTVEVVWSAQRDQVLITAEGLESLEPGLAYQLWFVNGTVSPAPTFTTDENGATTTLLDVDDLDPQGWGVTIEPLAGSRQPTSEVLYSGTI
jgi:anti-sigma-K factor RskA